MKTERTKVTQEVHIWAIPKSEWEIQESPNELPFRYQMFTNHNTPWQDGSVKVSSHDVDLYVPADIDLLGAAIETLKEQIETVRNESWVKIKKFEEQIQNLTLLEHKPEEV